MFSFFPNLCSFENSKIVKMAVITRNSQDFNPKIWPFCSRQGSEFRKFSEISRFLTLSLVFFKVGLFFWPLKVKGPLLGKIFGNSVSSYFDYIRVKRYTLCEMPWKVDLRIQIFIDLTHAWKKTLISFFCQYFSVEIRVIETPKLTRFSPKFQS